MAIINITLNTDLGDTLQDVVNALLAQTKPVPHGSVAAGAVAGDLTRVQHPYTEQNVLNGKAGQPISEKVQIPVEASERIASTYGPDPAAKFPEPTGAALTAMDGDRKRGEPGAGHRRRTNKEIEEDKRYFDSLKVPGHAAVAAMEQGVEGQSAPDPTSASTVGSSVKTAETTVSAKTGVIEQSASISSGEERVGPDDAQDAADEAAESEKNRGAEPTLDDLRRVVGDYQKKFGMAQAATRTKEILGMSLLEVPSKDIPVMIHKIAAALEHDKPEGAKFTPVQTQSGVVQQVTIAAPKTATRDEVNAALNDYATRYDGSLDPKQMPITREDVPRILERLFGAGKKSFNDFEKSPENLGRVLAAVRAEIEKNTFGRTPK